MMFIDHISSSIILSNSIPIIRNKRILWIVCIVFSLFPDILAFFYHPGTIEYLSHRKYTNSIILAPFYVLIIAVIVKLLSYKRPIQFYLIFFTSLLSYFLHIILDLITEYGSPLFFPFSNNLYSLDLIHSFDPIFLTISFILIVFSLAFLLKKHKAYNRMVRIALYSYLIYMTFMFIYKIAASYNFEKYLSSNYHKAVYQEMIPRTFWRWRAIATDENKILQLNGALTIRNVQEFNNIANIPAYIKHDNYFKEFVSYARYPVVQVDKEQISIFNAIYSIRSYRLTYIIKADSIIGKSISGFDLTDR